MQGLHCGPFSGHLGLKCTLLKAKERYFWQHMTTQLQDFVKNCQVCFQIKLDPNHIKAPLQSITVNEPFVFWAMDYMVPCLKPHKGINSCLLLWITSPSGVRCFLPKTKRLGLLLKFWCQTLSVDLGHPLLSTLVRT